MFNRTKNDNWLWWGEKNVVLGKVQFPLVSSLDLGVTRGHASHSRAIGLGVCGIDI